MKFQCIVVAVMLALMVLIVFALGFSFLSRTSVQRQAIQSLNAVAFEAMSRNTDATDYLPSYSFDAHGPLAVEDIIGPTYLGNVTDVCFRMSDDEQIIDSLPHLQRFDHLKRIMFYLPPSDAVIASVGDALPNVALVNAEAKSIP